MGITEKFSLVHVLFLCRDNGTTKTDFSDLSDTNWLQVNGTPCVKVYLSRVPVYLILISIVSLLASPLGRGWVLAVSILAVTLIHGVLCMLCPSSPLYLIRASSSRLLSPCRTSVLSSFAFAGGSRQIS